MKYYKIVNGQWQRAMFDPNKKQIKLYNDDFTVLGIGLY